MGAGLGAVASGLGVSGKVAAEGAGRSHPVPSRCSYLILELMAGSQGSWDPSKSPAWGWEVGMWGTNIPSRSVFRTVTGAARLLRQTPAVPDPVLPGCPAPSFPSHKTQGR